MNGKVQGRCLVRLQKPDCNAILAGIDKTGVLNWSNAVIWSSAVKKGDCGLTDGSVEGDWRLPTKTELQVLTTGVGQVLAGAPGSFAGVRSNLYWSSTTDAPNPGDAWFVGLFDGYMNAAAGKGGNAYVWPVRGGL